MPSLLTFVRILTSRIATFRIATFRIATSRIAQTDALVRVPSAHGAARAIERARLRGGRPSTAVRSRWVGTMTAEGLRRENRRYAREQMSSVFELLVTVLLLGACRPVDRSVGTNPVPVLTPVVDASVPASVRARNADTTNRRVVVASDDDLARTVVSVFGDTAALHPSSVTTPDAEPVWDIDVHSYETHDRVAFYVQLFSNGSRQHFRERLSRGTRYEPMIRAKLRASGMPEDLTYLALIESGYDPHAYSRAAAVGLWQFMSSTARDVGMRVDWWVDERRDPARSTDGAIRFLADLQKQFGSLYLAAAAYNGGPGRVARGLTRYAGEMEGTEGEDRFFALAEQDYLRTETKNYVPQLIAAALIAKLPSRYGLSVDSLPLFVYDSVLVDAGTSLAAVAMASGASTETMRDLNPAILRGIVPPESPLWLHVPLGAAERTSTELTSLSDSERLGYATVRVTGTTTTIASLAAKNGMEVRHLAWYNPSLKTGKKGRIAEGTSVRIPTRATIGMARSVPDPSIERYGGGATTSLASRGVHVVRRGETLTGIARKYGISATRLKALNGIKSNRVVVGQTLRVRSVSRVAANSAKTAAKTTAKSSTKATANASGKGAAKSGKGSSKMATATKSSSTKAKGSAARSTKPKNASTKTSAGKSAKAKSGAKKGSATKSGAKSKGSSSAAKKSSAKGSAAGRKPAGK